MRRLRFGVMCEGPTLSRWQYDCLRHLHEAGDSELALVIHPARTAARRRPGPLRKLMDPRRRARFNLYSVYRDLWLLPRARRSVLRPTDASKLLAGAPVLRCEPQRAGRFSVNFSEADIAAIEAHGLDFIVVFAFGIIRGPILDSARFGLWSYHHNDETKYRGDGPCFWEVLNRDPVTGAILQRLTDELDAGVILFKGRFPTRTDSWLRNYEHVLAQSARWCALVAKDIRVNGAPSRAAKSPSDVPIRKKPSSAQLLRFLWRQAGAKLARLATKRFTVPVWNVGWTRETVGTVLATGALGEVAWLPPPPRGRFIADPHVLPDDRVLRVLVEDYDMAARRGHIAELELDTDAARATARAAISRGSHLSYPFVLSHDGARYCFVENYRERHVPVYRRTAAGWELAARILQGTSAVDASVIEHAGRLWLFCTMNDEANDYLHIYSADRIEGPWRPHEVNPVKCDAGCTRPAGAPFVHEGELYRPAQDCSTRYGGAVAINRVTHLSDSRFAEEVVCRIEPAPDGPYPHGVHTLSLSPHCIVLDGLRLSADPRDLLGKARRALNRLPVRPAGRGWPRAGP